MVDDIQQPEDQLEEAQAGNQIASKESETSTEVVDYKDKWLRAAADYQNLQKEVAQQRSLWAKMSKIDVLIEFIPVYENFKKAFQSAKPSLDPSTHVQCDNWKKGIEFIMKQFEEILRRHSITEIKTVGERFDPTRHEAVGEEESEQDEGTIIREVEGGYMVDEHILKPAKVIVSKKS